MGRKSFLTRDEERELIVKAQAGCIASRNRLVESNLPMIYKWVIRHVRRWPGYIADELIGEAVMGYMHGIEKFDLSHNTRLSTYAGHWVFNSLQLFTSGNRSIIHVPHYQDGKGRQYEDDAVRARAKFVSLSAPPSRFQEGGLNEIDVHAPAAPALPDMPSEDEVWAVLDTLPERWREIMVGRIEGKTLREIGEEMGVTRERIRQIETSARRYLFDKLQHKIEPSLARIYRAVI